MSDNRLALIAIGGNSLIKDKAHQSVDDQYQTALETCRNIASVIEKGWRVVVTHGNGPQVGFILLRSEMSRASLHEVPLVSCVADTQGAIGFHLQMGLHNALLERGRTVEVATVVTQCVVDATDKSFQNPTKPIGLFYSQEEAEKAVAERGWTVVEDAGRGWRRVVPSPKPTEVVEVPAIRALLEKDVMVIAAGGGGIPVVREPDGQLRGVDAVIDKDLASSLLATALGVDTLVISTAVPSVYLAFGKPDQRRLDEVTVGQMKAWAAEGHFAKGSMAPKVDAAIGFLERGGRQAIITSPELVEDALEGKAGTRIVQG